MNKLQIIYNALAAFIGAALGFLFGKLTGLFWALIAFMTLDYLTGVIIAIINKKLSSEVGFRGLGKKFLILIFVAVGHILDAYVLGTAGVTMSAVVLFYIANEGVSIVENAALLGLPVPERLKDILEQIQNKSDDENEEKNNEKRN